VNHFGDLIFAQHGNGNIRGKTAWTRWYVERKLNEQRLICGHGGHSLAWIYFLWAILLKQHAKQSIRRDRNDQKAARHANRKHPAQNMSDNLEQSTPPNTLGAFYQEL